VVPAVQSGAACPRCGHTTAPEWNSGECNDEGLYAFHVDPHVITRSARTSVLEAIAVRIEGGRLVRSRASGRRSRPPFGVPRGAATS